MVLQNLKVGNRLGLGFGIVLALMLLTTVVTFWSLKTVESSTDQVASESLPFTLLAGHASEAAETLMLGPAEATFMRCLGCRNTGYTRRDIEQIERNEERAEAEAS